MNKDVLAIKRKVEHSDMTPDALLIVYENGSADFFEFSPFSSDLYRYSQLFFKKFLFNFTLLVPGIYLLIPS